MYVRIRNVNVRSYRLIFQMVDLEIIYSITNSICSKFKYVQLLILNKTQGSTEPSSEFQERTIGP